MKTLQTKTKIALIGPTGVGKTSLLAAMYDSVERFSRMCGAQFSATPQTRHVLDIRRKELKSITDNFIPDLIGGTSEKRDFDFTFTIAGGQDFALQFTDIPGGWWSGVGNPHQAVKELAASAVSIWCIDAVALMEGSDGIDIIDGTATGVGTYHSIINEPETIFDTYQKCLKSLPDKHTIIVVLFRAETYLQDRKTEENLFARVKAVYQSRIFTLQKLANHQQKMINCFFCNVQTLGCVEFADWDTSLNPPRARFKRIGNKEYSPSNCDVPLAVALRANVNRVIEQFLQYQTQEAQKLRQHTELTKRHQEEAEKLSRDAVQNRKESEQLRHESEQHLLQHRGKTREVISHNENANMGSMAWLFGGAGIAAAILFPPIAVPALFFGLKGAATLAEGANKEKKESERIAQEAQQEYQLAQNKMTSAQLKYDHAVKEEQRAANAVSLAAQSFRQAEEAQRNSEKALRQLQISQTFFNRLNEYITKAMQTNPGGQPGHTAKAA